LALKKYSDYIVIMTSTFLYVMLLICFLWAADAIYIFLTFLLFNLTYV